MDEFGVLTERFGLKPQGKSAPMAASKLSNGANRAQIGNFSSNSGFGSKSFPNGSKSGNNLNSLNGSFHDDDIFFGGQKPQSSVGGVDGFDIFGGFPKNLMQSSKNGNGSTQFDGDLLGGFGGSNSSSADDIFGSFGSSTKQANPVDDLLGGFSAKPTAQSQNGSVGFDDLIPGFGTASSSKKGDNKGVNQATFPIDDPFSVFESTSTTTASTFTDPLEEFSQFSQGSKKPSGSSIGLSPIRPPPRPGQVSKSEKVKNSSESSIDELEEFARGNGSRNTGLWSDVHSGNKVKQTPKANKSKEDGDATRKSQQNSAPDLESFFSTHRSSSVPKERTATLDPLFDVKVNSRRDPAVPQRTSNVNSPGMKKANSATHMSDDFFSMFGDITSIGEFEEVEGESEERRKARLERHLRTKDRVAQAVADMNQRDLKSQYEQEERARIAETLDAQIKRWAAGKEGNMRALLSSLQYVLWAESGWEPVSLTDLITSTSVRKVYRRANLCVHPDKVQQKGSTLEQKYIAEKVFDILKESWTKFNKDELS